jgi:hypothetical protein
MARTPSEDRMTLPKAMHPAHRGLADVWWGRHVGYIGGPLDGQPVEPGYQSLRRDESGCSLRVSKNMAAHYVLHTANADHLRAYLHTSVTLTTTAETEGTSK